MKGQLRIDTVFAFIVRDDDGTEGVPAVSHDGLLIPLMGADADRIDDFREIVKTDPRFLGKTITLAQFSVRKNLEVIKR